VLKTSQNIFVTANTATLWQPPITIKKLHSNGLKITYITTAAW